MLWIVLVGIPVYLQGFSNVFAIYYPLLVLTVKLIVRINKILCRLIFDLA